jgi:hypothetical protein
MNRHVAIWATLALAHVALCILAILFNSDRLGAVAGGSIYGPLVAVDRLGVPVFGNKSGYVPEIAPLGWIIVVSLWLAVYWGIARFLVRIVDRRTRAA